MAPSILKKRKNEDPPSQKPNKKFRKQQHYSSPSASSAAEADEEDPQEFPPIDLLADSSSSEGEPSPLIPHIISNSKPDGLTPQPSTSATDSDLVDDSSDSATTPSDTTHPTSSSRKTQKRNDPTAFATSISTILSSKLTTAKRSDPVLSRSATAHDANASLANSKLEAKAKRKIRDDRRTALERGRVKDVLLGSGTAGGGGEAGGEGKGYGDGEGGKSVGQLQEEERKLRKTAQRGVVKLFNAVRASQVRAEEARAKGGTRGRKEERVEEMSKLGFLEMVAAGGGGGKGNVKGKGREELVGEGIDEA